jgi:hypothetical protein
MKKLVALVLLLCLSLNTFAASGSIQELSNAIDDYQYAMSVEWDQKDQAFKEKQVKMLQEKMQELMGQGLSEAEVMQFLEEKMGSKVNLAAMKLKISMMKETSSAKEMMKMLLNDPAQFYTKGASWNGSIFQSDVIIVVAIIAGIILLGLLAQPEYELGNYECTRYEEVYECTTDVHWYSDTRSTETTTCGYKTQCASWREVAE